MKKIGTILGSFCIAFIICIPFIEEKGQKSIPKVYPERTQDTIKSIK